ncbi:hypothetical protein UY3_04076 [Chelonia mydas]|uniref:Uncharacterized protein n=1 Tax=Chelonia mydas TaxID=8469 RepID=M7CDB2_CHEMY|nr:hypothetical protein UY3_04076 [Chelonia mydas]
MEVALKSTLLGRIWSSADTNQRYWPPGAIPECSIVTALDSTFNSDGLARYTVKALGTFEFHFLFDRRGELISTGNPMEISGIPLKHKQEQALLVLRLRVSSLPRQPVHFASKLLKTCIAALREAQMELMGEWQQVTHHSEDTTVSQSKYVDFNYVIHVAEVA